MEFVTNSGAILFTKLLELFNFTLATSTSTMENPKLRYALLTGEKSNASKEITTIIGKFNDEKNCKGDYIKVIIGSSVLAEGFTLKNVQHVHILTPSWNFSETDQVIARAFRLFSHDSLKKFVDHIVVNIYLYCAIFNHDLNRSIDWRMFKTSEDKDIAIKSIERSLKEISVDCELNKVRNMEHKNNKGTRECEYMDCEYQCEEEPYTFKELDRSTYNLYYDNDEVDRYISIISKMFQSRYKIRFSEMISYITDILGHNNDEETLTKAIYRMISRHHVIKDKLGFHCFLRQEHDYLYLTHSLKPNHTFLDVYYVEHFPLQQNSYDENFTVLQKEKIISLCKNLTSSDVIEPKNITKFPIEFQEMILKLAIQHKNSVLDEKSTKNRDMILDYFKNEQFYDKDTDTIIITVKKPYQCFSIKSNEWSICTNEQIEIIEKLNVIEYDPETHPGYVGKYVRENDKDVFKIIDLIVSSEAKNKVQQSTGRTCETIDKEDLLNIIDKVKVEMNNVTDDEFKKQFGLSMSEDVSNLIDHVYEKESKYFARLKAVRNLYTREKLSQKNKEDLIRILYWGSSAIKTMCNRLYQWFIDHDMMYDKNYKKISK